MLTLLCKLSTEFFRKDTERNKYIAIFSSPEANKRFREAREKLRVSGAVAAPLRTMFRSTVSIANEEFRE